MTATVLEFARRPPRFVRETFVNIEPRGAEWLVKHFLPAQGVGFVVGASKARKTFFAIDLALNVAHGRDFLGHRTQGCGVLYLAAEAPNGARKRIKAWRERRGGDDAWFELIGQAPDLMNGEDCDALRTTLSDAAEEALLAGHRLGLVVVDTLAASLCGADENSGRDMGAVMHRLTQMAVDLKVLILLVGHTGKNEALGLRGWSGQFAGGDVVILLSRSEGDPNVTVGHVDKLKEHEDGEQFAFRLETVELGHDGDGDPVTSAVTVYQDAPEPVSRTRRVQLSAHAMKIQSAFGRLFDAGRDVDAPNVDGVRPGTRAVALNDLRSMAFEIGLGGALEPGPDADSKEKERFRDGRKKAWARGLEQLEREKLLRSERGFVWELRR